MRSELDRECDRTPKVTGTFRYGAARVYRDDMPNNWRVTLRLEGRQLSTDFYGGAFVASPSVADVLYALMLDARAGEVRFEEFCVDFGHDEDSRAAEALWLTCRRLAPRVRRFVGSHWDRFERCEH